MKKKKLLTLIGSICLSLVLAALLLPACAPVEVAEEVAELEEEIADLEDDVAAEKTKTAAEKAKVSDLEDEIAALKKPVEVQEWEPASYTGAGLTWDALVHIADVITRNSDGRIVVTPSLPGAVCPVEEQLTALAMGVTEAMFWYSGYFSGQIPMLAVSADVFYAPVSPEEAKYLYADYKGGQITELIRDTYAEYGDIYLVGYSYHRNDGPMCSKVPLYGAADLKGLPWRSSEVRAEVLAYFGAGTVWCPGPEIYTLLATGVVDGVNYGDVLAMIDMGFWEVTKYWVKKPLITATSALPFCVNTTVWNELPDDLKGIVETAAVESATMKGTVDGKLAIANGWKKAEELGMELIEWSDEDCLKFYEAFRLKTEAYRTDPATDKLYTLMEPYIKELGYWK